MLWWRVEHFAASPPGVTYRPFHSPASRTILRHFIPRFSDVTKIYTLFLADMSHAPARITKAAVKGASPGGIVTSWSLHDTPPSDDAIRVRNNQRRHRERVKTRIADLEAKVAYLETDLRSANDLIEELRRENEALRMTKAPSQPSQQLPSSPQRTVTPQALRPLNETSTAPSSTERRVGGGFCCRPGPGDEADGETSDREDYPAPLDGESTTDCQTAYTLLKQQSAGQLDPETAEQFLRPGYRRAMRQGEGCRVQTHLVYGLLDKITS